jgi:hypothetical protein
MRGNLRVCPRFTSPVYVRPRFTSFDLAISRFHDLPVFHSPDLPISRSPGSSISRPPGLPGSEALFPSAFILRTIGVADRARADYDVRIGSVIRGSWFDAVFGTRNSELRTQDSGLSTQYSVLSTQYSVLSTHPSSFVGDCVADCWGAAPGAGAFLFAVRPKRKARKRKGAPVRRRYLVPSCGIPALLDQSGGLRNSRTVHAIPSASGGISLRKSMRTRGSPSARPSTRHHYWRTLRKRNT